MCRAVVACLNPNDNVHHVAVLLQLDVGNGVHATNGTMGMCGPSCAPQDLVKASVCAEAAPGLTTAVPPKEIHYHTQCTHSSTSQVLHTPR
jgi:hypothetical protein